MSIVYAVRNRLIEGYDPRKGAPLIPVKRKGVLYDLGGEQVELFRISVMAEALDRSVEVLKDWTKGKKIPKPLYRIDGNQCSHWYSAAQIINCHRLMHGGYGGRKFLPSEELQRFWDGMRAVWTSRDIIVGEDGTIQMGAAS